MAACDDTPTASAIEQFVADMQYVQTFVETDAPTATTPQGKSRTTLAGIQADVDAVINSTGWFVAGDFTTGFTFTARNQVGRDSTGEFWSYNGTLPFTVTAGTTPSAPNYTQRGDAALRSALASGTATIRHLNGTAANPSITFGADTDTGLFRKAENTLGFSTAGVERVLISPAGRVAIGSPIFDAKFFVNVDNDISAGGRFKARWVGGGVAPSYQNNDVVYVETFNDVQGDSENFSWGLSCSNTFNKIPAGVTDNGRRLGVYGWAPSVNAQGYTHAGILESQIGVWGRAGFQGEGMQASPAGAQVNKAVGVRGDVIMASPGAKILDARAGEFLSFATADVAENYSVYAQAQGGSTANWSFFGAAGEFINIDKSFFGQRYTDVSSSKLSARGAGSIVEFGFADVGGYEATLGSSATSGLPMITFCCKSGIGDTYTTTGRTGHVIFNGRDGNLYTGVTPVANAANQNLTLATMIQNDGTFRALQKVTLSGLPTYADNASAVAGGLVVDGVYKTTTGELRIVV